MLKHHQLLVTGQTVRPVHAVVGDRQQERETGRQARERVEIAEGR